MDLPLYLCERRRNLRFPILLPVLVHGFGDAWMVGETTDVSTHGARFICDRPFLLSAGIDYVLTLPPELTKASRPLRVRFVATVVRCERVSEDSRTFSIAVRSHGHRYVTVDEASCYDVIEQSLVPATKPGYTVNVAKPTEN